MILDLDFMHLHDIGNGRGNVARTNGDKGKGVATSIERGRGV